MITIEECYLCLNINWFEFAEKLTDPTFTCFMRAIGVNYSFAMPFDAPNQASDGPVWNAVIFLDQHRATLLKNAWVDRVNLNATCNSLQNIRFG